MAAGQFAKKINYQLRKANFLEEMSARRHSRARKVAERALAAKEKGFHRRAARLIRQALRLTRMAVRAAYRAKKHRAHIADLRQQRGIIVAERAAR